MEFVGACAIRYRRAFPFRNSPRPEQDHSATPLHMSSITPRSLAAALFVPDGDEYHQCRICFSRRKQVRGTGYTNPVEHLVRCHASTYENDSGRFNDGKAASTLS
ncbi:hypothetical protein L915_04255 [Phytophthora nicotianae]|uniref:BED-type domain-containing protein n=3 Tax=Phytophthora nicotianae TaxID=4792 RepID=W2HAS6_PHYNI|nr:hypothetical protein L915_04255 [Phytophthora nicotianae]